MINQNALDKIYNKKQQEVLRYHYNNDYFILINHGAVRSGKTHVDNDIFISELRRISQYAKVKGIKNPL